MEAEIRDVRIERYYPDVLINSKEFSVLSKAVDPELANVWKALWKQFLNTFIYLLDKGGATRWESMLNLHPAVTDSLDTRRKVILAKINSSLPYTHRSFQITLNGIYGENNVKVSLQYNKYECWLDITASLLYRSSAIKNLASVVIPANLSILVSNTKYVVFEIYSGLSMRMFKHIYIHPGVTFNIQNGSKIACFYSLTIRKMRHIKIRSR
ncbi:putative phage tail protein [Pectinatus frisingensis]|uniref:putative phage tail protein n=1 Tax=Pectinatus frisingensis TaxID=865 RepID=UPI0015F5E01D|nr:putative phage tail protein [Pectinatus frisingensis]